VELAYWIRGKVLLWDVFGLLYIQYVRRAKGERMFDLNKFLEMVNVHRKSRKYNRDMSILSYVRMNDRTRALNMFFQHGLEFISSETEANETIERFQKIVSGLDREYDTVLNSEAMRCFQRPWLVTDYKVSAIGRNEFSDDAKDILRKNRHVHGDISDCLILLEWSLKRFSKMAN